MRETTKASHRFDERKPDPHPAARNDIGAALAARIRLERAAREWSMEELAQRASISRAMISKIEREACSPTAMILGRLSGAFKMSMSSLLANAEGDRRLVRFEEQQVWKDPESGYTRRSVSPAPNGPLQLVEVELPPRTRLTFPQSSYDFNQHQIWILSGRLLFSEGATVHDLRKGDCLELGLPAECVFENPSASAACRYLVVVVVR